MYSTQIVSDIEDAFNHADKEYDESEIILIDEWLITLLLPGAKIYWFR